MTVDLVDYVFGEGNHDGGSAVERASASRIRFVRSQDHLSLAKPTATGHVLNAEEALRAFGIEKLAEVVDYGSAILPSSVNEPADTIRLRREALGFSVPDLAHAAGVDESVVVDCEDPRTRSSIQILEKLAVILGLDERVISVIPGAYGDDALAVRLKTIRGNEAELSSPARLIMSEAAWVIRTQYRLQELLGVTASVRERFTPNAIYRDGVHAPWKQGYALAKQARSLLGLSDSAPISDVWTICKMLAVPLLRVPMPNNIAGITISSNGYRGIAINSVRRNENRWLMRAAIAHELGHLLWDPNERLEKVRVNQYSDLERLERQNDEVESRANAFGIAFLAPPQAVRELFLRDGAEVARLRNVMDQFGISFTAAKFHVGNVLGRAIGVTPASMPSLDPGDAWSLPEEDPARAILPQEIPELRRGKFSGMVSLAFQRGHISVDTAASYLSIDADLFKRKVALIGSAYPPAALGAAASILDTAG